MASNHGGNLRELAQRAGLPEDEILDLSASINPLGPPETLRPVIARNLERLVHYPDPEARELVDALAQRFGTQADEIVVGNGSSELLHAIARSCSYCRAYVPTPCYGDYATAVEVAGGGVERLQLDEKRSFALDWSALDERTADDGILFLGQPNNPTGRLLDSDSLLAFAERHPLLTIVVDEAFADFVDGYRSLAGHAPGNVIVLRSLTKFYAIPGLRLGAAFASPAIVAAIKRRLPPWSVNALAQAVGVALLKDEGYAERTIALVCRQREELVRCLESLPGVQVYPSVANFLLVKCGRPEWPTSRLAARLLEKGIAIRTFTPTEHLDERFFRVAVRTERENGRLCDALAGILGSRRPVKAKQRTPALMFQGTSSNAGKSVLAAGICRALLQDGVRVAPFKAQNMSLNSFIARDGEMGRAQVVQAQACRLEPDVRMNPVLLKPNSDTGSQVIIRGKPVGNMRVGEYVRYKPQAFLVVQECYDSLASDHDAIVIEGAGSPGEVNLKSHDIVNMRMAQHAGAPVLIVGDIDRGGVFASFVGTLEVLAAWERRRVAGWIVNRFRGDPSLLGPAFDYTVAHTGRPVLGVVPYLPNLNLPEEDSVEFKSRSSGEPREQDGAVEIAVIDLPHISNFTDFDPFHVEPDVVVRIVRRPEELGKPDAIILPGSKNTLGDLASLRTAGLDADLKRLAQQGTEIVGICAGLQMLGRAISDPEAIESAAEGAAGLGLLDASTVLAQEKTLARTTACHTVSGLEVSGYEIHHGRTTLGSSVAIFVQADGRVVGIADESGRVWGTYLHGVFDNDSFRRWFVDRLRIRRGLPAIGSIVGRYDLEPALDRLAEVVRSSLPMDRIYRLMGLS